MRRGVGGRMILGGVGWRRVGRGGVRQRIGGGIDLRLGDGAGDNGGRRCVVGFDWRSAVWLGRRRIRVCVGWRLVLGRGCGRPSGGVTLQIGLRCIESLRVFFGRRHLNHRVRR